MVLIHSVVGHRCCAAASGWLNQLQSFPHGSTFLKARQLFQAATRRCPETCRRKKARVSRTNIKLSLMSCPLVLSPTPCPKYPAPSAHKPSISAAGYTSLSLMLSTVT